MKLIKLVLLALLLTSCAKDEIDQIINETVENKYIPVEVKQSPDKYTYYVKDYIGKNCATIGYESLGGDRNDRYGATYVKLVMMNSEGTYIDVTDEFLKDYVVVDQEPKVNTEIKLVYDVDSNGEEYDNLVEWANINRIVLQVKKVGSKTTFEHKLIEPTLPTNHYEDYVKDYVGLNVLNCGYISLGGDLRDHYGKTSMKLVLVSDDGSYVDLDDEEGLKQYKVYAQNPSANTRMTFEYSKDSKGNEYSFTSYESLDSIELYVTKVNQ